MNIVPAVSIEASLQSADDPVRPVSVENDGDYQNTWSRCLDRISINRKEDKNKSAHYALCRLNVLYGIACLLSFIALIVGVVLLSLAYQHHKNDALTAEVMSSEIMDDDYMILLNKIKEDPQPATTLWLQLRKQVILGITNSSYILSANDEASLFLATSKPSSPQAQALRWFVLQEQLREVNQEQEGTGVVGPLRFSRLPVEQRYALAVFYYHWSGKSWFLSPADGWLRTNRDHQLPNVNMDSIKDDPSLGENQDDNYLVQPSSEVSVMSDDDRVKENFTQNNITEIPVNECYWVGVKCNTDQNEIIGLNFSLTPFAGHLDDFLPTEIGYLVSLELLDLRNHNLQGSVPPEWHTLTNLKQIDLHSNQLTGFAEFSSLSSEPLFVLGEWKQLESLQLSNNRFTELPISALRQLTNLQNLDLLNNPELVIVDDIGIGNATSSTPIWSSIEYWPNMTIIDTSSTKIDTSLPENIGLLSNLQQLTADQTVLYGTIPTSIGNLSNLNTLSLQFPINNDAAIGPLPTEIGRLTSLQFLALDGDGVTGTLVSEIQYLTDLTVLTLTHNSGLKGTLPTELGRLTSLLVFQIPVTSFSGTVPSQLGMATSLYDVQLQYTHLTGTIPEELCKLNWERFEADCPAGPGAQVHVVQCDCCTQCFGVK